MQKYFSRSGMTMIELVSALMLFILILGALTMALNKATTLWSTSHTNQYEKERANLILALITDDLQLAVTDNGIPTDASGTPPATFYCDTTTNQSAAADAKLILQFIRHRTKPSPFDSSPDAPPALDAVFYVFSQDALFRHVIPLKYPDPNTPEHIGTLLENLTDQNQDVLRSAEFHARLLAHLKNPLGADPEPALAWEYSLLADRVLQPLIIAGIPERYINKNRSNLISTPAGAQQNLQSISEYNQVESSVLPDYLDISLRIFNEVEWNRYLRLFDTALDDETFARAQAHLGAPSSRRISFKTMRGARLP